MSSEIGRETLGDDLSGTGLFPSTGSEFWLTALESDPDYLFGLLDETPSRAFVHAENSEQDVDTWRMVLDPNDAYRIVMRVDDVEAFPSNRAMTVWETESDGGSLVGLVMNDATAEGFEGNVARSATFEAETGGAHLLFTEIRRPFDATGPLAGYELSVEKVIDRTGWTVSYDDTGDDVVARFVQGDGLTPGSFSLTFAVEGFTVEGMSVQEVTNGTFTSLTVAQSGGLVTVAGFNRADIPDLTFQGGTGGGTIVLEESTISDGRFGTPDQAFEPDDGFRAAPGQPGSPDRPSGPDGEDPAPPARPGLVTSGDRNLSLRPGDREGQLLGAEDLSLLGNRADNVLTGNAGDNVIAGLGGDDRLVGAGGADTFALVAGFDGTATIADFTGADRIAFDDRLFGLDDGGIDLRGVDPGLVLLAIRTGLLGYDAGSGALSVPSVSDEPLVILEDATGVGLDSLLLF